MDQLLISPDGPICDVPFCALPLKLQRGYLVDDFDISYLLSVQSLARPRVETSGKLHLVFGGMVYENTPWPSLPLSFSEAELVRARLERLGISMQFPPSDQVTFSELQFYQTVTQKKAATLHFAGHAEFDMQVDHGQFNPYVSPNTASAFLVFSDAKTRLPVADFANDGFVTAAEIEKRDFRDMELAVISACQTGRGAELGGEGLLSLQRSFAVAGCQNTVSSKWHVVGGNTTGLMTDLYSRCNATRTNLPSALASAQRSLKQIAPHPKYWAAWAVHTN